MPSIPETAYFTLAPDWVCEELSPGTARLDRLDKLAGTHADRDEVRAEPFDAIGLELSRLWAD